MKPDEKAFTILLVDDEKSIRITLKMLLEEAGYRVIPAGNGREALDLLDENVADLLITDLRMKPMDGLTLMREALKKDPSLEVIFMSAYSDVGSAVKAIKSGAFDYVIKSFRNEELLLTVEKAVEKKKLLMENESIRRRLENRYSVGGYVFRDPKMGLIVQNIEKISKSGATVLLTGESGTGKEVLARIIHEGSPRRAGKFAVIDCSAIPASLLESEIFGYEKGAFTGAAARRIGKFEAADGGTVFLDEIGELPLPMQTGFLRVLQEKQFQRVGGTEPVKVDVRIIAATNKNLEKEVREGRFREDLYYRLNICRIAVPPLRSRRDDIPPLAETFLEAFAREYGKKLRCIGTDVLFHFLEHPFPGNIRQLKNMIEQAVILADENDEVLTLGSLAAQAGGGSTAPPQIPPDESPLRDYEKFVIENLLKRHNGNKNKIASILGIKRQTLYNKLKKYDIG